MFVVPAHDEVMLIAVCDVLVLKALENLGKWIVRHERCRPKQWRGRPLYEAHTHWRPDSTMIVKSLRGAWAIVPDVLDRWGDSDHVDVEQFMNTLDSYVYDLAVTGHPHTLDTLTDRLTPFTRTTV